MKAQHKIVTATKTDKHEELEKTHKIISRLDYNYAKTTFTHG